MSLDVFQKKINDSDIRLNTLNKDLLRNKNDQLKLLMDKLKLTDPKQVLSKGYAMVKKNGRIAVSLDELSTGDNIQLLMQDGELSANIISKSERPPNSSARRTQCCLLLSGNIKAMREEPKSSPTVGGVSSLSNCLKTSK